MSHKDKTNRSTPIKTQSGILHHDEPSASADGFDTCLYVWGPNFLQNSLLAQFVENTTQHTCSCLQQWELPRDCLGKAEQHIFLCDCWQLETALHTERFHRATEQIPGASLVLFNITKETDLTKEIGLFEIRGIFFENDGLDVFKKGIKRILKGELWLSRDQIAKSLIKARQGNNGYAYKEELNALTKREKEILGLIKKGLSNSDISEKLFISIHTVKTHIANIYTKIDVPNRVQAIVWASQYLY